VASFVTALFDKATNVKGVMNLCILPKPILMLMNRSFSVHNISFAGWSNKFISALHCWSFVHFWWILFSYWL